MRASPPLVAGVELGGTKCVCLLGTGPDDIREERRLPTEAPETTLPAIAAVLREWKRASGFAALGIAAFGPVVTNREASDWGRFGRTPKPGWSGAELVRTLVRGLAVPVGFDTDVNAAALAEGRWGAARGFDDFAYITVGTGVGVGPIVHGRPVGGFMHAEAGHLRVARAPGDDWPGACPFHGDCVEGLAAGPAIAARLGRDPADAGSDDPVWSLVAQALAQLVHNLTLTVAPRRVLIGGGVMTSRPDLFPLVRAALDSSLGGYIELPDDEYVMPPGLGAMAGPAGALVLAIAALAAAAKEKRDGRRTA